MESPSRSQRTQRQSAPEALLDDHHQGFMPLATTAVDTYNQPSTDTPTTPPPLIGKYPGHRRGFDWEASPAQKLVLRRRIRVLKSIMYFVLVLVIIAVFVTFMAGLPGSPSGTWQWPWRF